MPWLALRVQTAENFLNPKLSSGSVVREQGLLQRLGPEAPGSLVFQPQGLQPSAFSRRVEPKGLGLGERYRHPEEHEREPTFRALSVSAQTSTSYREGGLPAYSTVSVFNRSHSSASLPTSPSSP